MPRLRIYTRPELMDDVRAEEMFDVYEAGLNFYAEILGVSYPFSKYDTVFMPEHNYGAMENIGAVTNGCIEGLESDFVHSNSAPSTTMVYNESYTFSGEKATLSKRIRFYISILHELCHMWFGTLVSISWWDDVGLNEAMATYLAFLALKSSPSLAEFKETG